MPKYRIDPEFASYLGEFARQAPARPRFGTRRHPREVLFAGFGEEPVAISVRLVQKGLNFLQRAGLRVDGTYGASTQRALFAWVQSLPAAARTGWTSAPSTDKKWLYVKPGAIATTLTEAASRPARAPVSAASGMTLAAAAQALQNGYNDGAEFKTRIERLAARSGGRIPSALANSYLAWFNALLGMQAMIVTRLETDTRLGQAIATREAGRTTASQMAATLRAERPDTPQVQVEGAAPTAQLAGGAALFVVAGVLVVVAVAYVLIAPEVAKVRQAEERTAQLRLTLAAAERHVITPAQVQPIIDATAPPAPPPADEQPPGPFDWVKWLAIAAGVVAAGFVGYEIVKTVREEKKGARAEARAERMLPSGD